MPENSKATIAPLITTARLHELYGLLLRVQSAEADIAKLFASRKWQASARPSLRHPAILAGCFAQLRPGDLVTDTRYEFAANLACGAPLAECVAGLAARARKAPPRRLPLPSPLESVAALNGAAQTLQATAPGAVMLAVGNESGLMTPAQDEIDGALHRMSSMALPLLLVTLSERLPEPGESQKARGIQQISVAGDDVVACYRVAYESLLRARAGIGPTWIRVWVGKDLAGSRATAATLTNMRQFLQTRNLNDATQPDREAAAWSREWKIAVKAATRKDPALLPIRALNVFG